jgi:uncharacterized protein YndB with AHSA1/START domain
MLVRSDRRHRFAVEPEELWAAIGEVGEYRRWWPWLRRFDAEGLEVGDVWRCTVQPPLPWTLRFRIEIEEVVPATLVRARVTGDVHGSARVEIAAVDPDAGGAACEARLVSELAPGNAVLRGIARLAQPLVRFGHDWILDNGARQFGERALG